MLIPIYVTQRSQQLNGPDRDEADRAVSAIILQGPAMKKEVSTELPLIGERMREILSSEAPEFYSWLMLATLTFDSHCDV